ncbi:MAG: YdjY domain-containing protein [Planctomycetes bacterium]|nr:YdjY domain-containing protein [Planctomycetota bacterium]
MNHLRSPLAILFLISLGGCDQAGTSNTNNAPVVQNPPREQAEKPTGTPRETGKRTPWPEVKRTDPTGTVSPMPDEPKETKPARVEEEEKEVPPEKDPPIPDSFKPLNKEKSIFFEKMADGTRRVHVIGEVCLREGPLEVLLCKKDTKEHESVLRADVDGREIHLALLAAGAKFGSTVKFVPVYKPATGDVIKVSVTFNKDGKLQTKPAQEWIQHLRSKKQMSHDWVFAGSRFFKEPDNPTKPPFYCANNGELISIANFPDSMLDLPVKSSKEESELGFVAWQDRIPPLKTKVIVTMEPVPSKK